MRFDANMPSASGVAEALPARGNVSMASTAHKGIVPPVEIKQQSTKQAIVVVDFSSVAEARNTVRWIGWATVREFFGSLLIPTFLIATLGFLTLVIGPHLPSPRAIGFEATLGPQCDSKLVGFSCVPGGVFWMGLEEWVHESRGEVEVTPFLMKKGLVSRSEWLALMGTEPWKTTPQLYSCDTETECPATNVLFFDAVKYVNELSLRADRTPCYELSKCHRSFELSQLNEIQRNEDICSVHLRTDCTGYRLPTEEQWEFAARLDGPDVELCYGVNSRPMSSAYNKLGIQMFDSAAEFTEGREVIISETELSRTVRPTDQHSWHFLDFIAVRGGWPRSESNGGFKFPGCIAATSRFLKPVVYNEGNGFRVVLDARNVSR